MISRISLATDFSAAGLPAFRAALSLAVACRARLDILHVDGRGAEPMWENFPHVRETLESWRLLPPQSRQEDVAAQLGVGITKVTIHGGDAATGIAEFVTRHRPDLLVAASHGGTGHGWWHGGSVAMEAMRLAALPALLFGPAARDLAEPATGRLMLGKILMPVAERPDPAAAAESLGQLLVWCAPEIEPVHVSPGGAMAGSGYLAEAVHLEGDVVSGILAAAAQRGVDVIAMPTARHKGLLGALRGSTTEAVLRQAACAVLALPV